MKTPMTLMLAASLFVMHAAARADDIDGTPDQAFANQAATAGLAEVALGKMASGRSHSAAIQQYGSMMVSDHSNANSELAAIAKAKNLVLPTQATAEQEQRQNSFESLRGDEFDTRFLQVMVLDHTAALSLFQREAASGADKDLRDFAARTVPTIREHLKQAQQLQASSGPTATSY